MMNERVTELLDYLNVLSQVQGSGHYVNEEIKEVVKELRLELGLEKRKLDTLKESRKLVFSSKVKNPTFRQLTIFEAIFGSDKKEITIPFFQNELEDVSDAIVVLKDMKHDKRITLENDKLILTVER